jgi:hypothetical protein
MARRLLLTLVLAVALTACSTVHYHLTGGRDPGAALDLTAEISDADHATRLRVRAVNLSPPERLVPEAQAYVLWARRDSERPWTCLGSLDYRPASRQGTLDATHHDVRFEVLLTTERGGEPPTFPSADVVFSQRVER